MKWPATIANLLWVGGSFPAWAAFWRALDRPAETQQHLLRELLSANANCAYGRAHGFGNIRSCEDFANRVPIAEYDEIVPWVDRIRSGEPNVLTVGPVTHLIPTSGSTGARKLIPFTSGLQAQMNRAIGPWIADLALQHPGILPGPAYWSITPQRPFEPDASAVPVGFADDAGYLGGVKSRLVRAAMVVPDRVDAGQGLEEFRFRTLLCLVRERDLRLISVWHPSFLALLLDELPNHWQRILAELRRQRHSRMNALEQSDPGRPDTLWPRLHVISCWGDHHAALPLADLSSRFPRVHIQPKGLLATEAFVSIPFGGCHPAAIRSHFFEFIDSRGRVRLVHELHPDETYEVIVTTGGGLWRYRLHDQVKVTRLIGRTPSLQFVGRAGNVSDLFGEKLSEAFVAEMIRQTMATLPATPRFVLLAPEQDRIGWRYVLFVEGAVSESIVATLDGALRQNPNYDHCRELGQLQPVGLFSIQERGFESFASRLVSEGRRLGDIKPSALSPVSGWSRTFPGTPRY